MATIEVSNADELLAAFATAKTANTTIQLTDDIDMNNNILTSSMTVIDNGYSITITGLHDTNQKYSIKNIQSTVSSSTSTIFSLSENTTVTYINFINMYCLTCPSFSRSGTFEHCEFYGTFKPSNGFTMGYVGGSWSNTPTYKYCSFTFDNCTLLNGGTVGATLSYCYVKYKSCSSSPDTTTYNYSNSHSNTFYTGELTDNAYSPLFKGISSEYCIYNITLKTTLSTMSYCSTPLYICLQNSTLAGDVTLSTGNTLVSLTDTQMKNFDDVYATGFPIVNYTES